MNEVAMGTIDVRDFQELKYLAAKMGLFDLPYMELAA